MYCSFIFNFFSRYFGKADADLIPAPDASNNIKRKKAVQSIMCIQLPITTGRKAFHCIVITNKYSAVLHFLFMFLGCSFIGWALSLECIFLV